MLTDRDCKRIVECLCEALKTDTQLQDVMANAMLRVSEPKRRLIKLAEAAALLGISTSQLYHIKDDADGRKRFSYVKQGKARSCPVLFDESKLIEEYERYLAEKNAVIPVNFKKVVG